MRPYDVMDIVESYSAGKIFKQQIQHIDAFSVTQEDQNYTSNICNSHKIRLGQNLKKSLTGHNNLVATVKQMKKQVINYH